MRRVYLDHAATTPLDPRVLEAMLPYLKEHFGNASSVHAQGRRARFAVEESRERVAALLGAEPGEVLFTSGGTEADNTAIKGVLRGSRRRLVTSAAEHEAVLHPAETRRAEGLPTTILTPADAGAVTPEQVREAITEDTGLVSLMHANNEIGTLTDIAAVAAVCRSRGVPLHTDAVQTAGLLPLNVDDLGVDLLSLSGHKFYGPKGVGVLYVRGGVEVKALMEGGAQERRRRGGTENVAAVVGLAEALDLAVREAEDRFTHVAALRSRLYEGLQSALGGLFVLNTPLGAGRSAPHLLNIAFPPRDGAAFDGAAFDGAAFDGAAFDGAAFDGAAFDGEMLLLNLDIAGVSASAGSACTSGALEPSHVLLALGRDRATASAAVRFSLGKDNTEADVEYAVEQLSRTVERMQRVGAN